jgi:hypothetical protein
MHFFGPNFGLAPPICVFGELASLRHCLAGGAVAAIFMARSVPSCFFFWS